MLLAFVPSKNGIIIRLTSERWYHIITSHLEINTENYKSIMDVVKNPDVIFKGDQEELLAVKKKGGKKTWIVVPYKEISRKDGFIITAYLTTDNSWLFKKEVIWSKE